MKGTTRYTISSKEGLPVRQESPKQVEDSLVQRSPPAIIAHDSNYSKVPTMDLSTHAGQPARIDIPQIGDDLSSRLEGLKLCKVWSERIREEAQQHPYGIPHIVSQSAQVVEDTAPISKAETISPRPVANTLQSTYRRENLIRQRSDSVDTRLDAAPTPVSSPAVLPVPNTTSRAEPVPDAQPLIAYSISPPGLILPETAASQPAEQPRRRRSIVITSTSSHELLQRSNSRSSSHSNTSVSSRSHVRDHKYPPVSFPQGLNGPDTGLRTKKDVVPAPIPRRPTPSISPLTMPQKDTDVKGQPLPPATPHDKRGRPTFYSTVHYYTECPHASPPATRPIDPNFQPRNDPDFHPTNPRVTRSIIPGSCFNCDTMHRRAQENVLLDDFAVAVTKYKESLTLRLDQLDQLDQIEGESSDAEYDAYNEDLERLRASCSFPEDVHDLRHQLSSMSLPPLHDTPEATPNTRHLTTEEKSFQARLVKEVRQIEAAIDTMRDEQDNKVRAVWNGYTRRWGPATLGVQRGNWSRDLERYETKDDHDAMLEHRGRSIEQRLAMPDEIDQLDLDEDDVRLQVIGVDNDQEEGHVSARSTSSQKTSGTNRLRRSQRSISRDSDTRCQHSPSIRDNPKALNPGTGKMQISWHR